MKGYKVFDPEWKCLGFQYEVGGTYNLPDGETMEMCRKGFHFCPELVDCFDYYPIDTSYHIAEVEAYPFISDDDGKRCAAASITIVREVPWSEVPGIVNKGTGNIGSGNFGSFNIGRWNRGDGNVGSGNAGSGNVGNRNEGDGNVGDSNKGSMNTGYGNSGYMCTGDFNSAAHCTGCFNTREEPMYFFDLPSLMTWTAWRKSNAFQLLRRVDLKPTEFVALEDMTEEEIADHPNAVNEHGFTRVRDNSKDYVSWWSALTDEEKEIIRGIPNFNAAKFSDITGIALADIEADTGDV